MEEVALELPYSLVRYILRYHPVKIQFKFMHFVFGRLGWDDVNIPAYIQLFGNFAYEFDEKYVLNRMHQQILVEKKDNLEGMYLSRSLIILLLGFLTYKGVVSLKNRFKQTLQYLQENGYFALRRALENTYLSGIETSGKHGRRKGLKKTAKSRGWKSRLRAKARVNPFRSRGERVLWNATKREVIKKMRGVKKNTEFIPFFSLREEISIPDDTEHIIFIGSEDDSVLDFYKDAKFKVRKNFGPVGKELVKVKMKKVNDMFDIRKCRFDSGEGNDDSDEGNNDPIVANWYMPLFTMTNIGLLSSLPKLKKVSMYLTDGEVKMVVLEHTVAMLNNNLSREHLVRVNEFLKNVLLLRKSKNWGSELSWGNRVKLVQEFIQAMQKKQNWKFVFGGRECTFTKMYMTLTDEEKAGDKYWGNTFWIHKTPLRLDNLHPFESQYRFCGICWLLSLIRIVRRMNPWNRLLLMESLPKKVTRLNVLGIVATMFLYWVKLLELPGIERQPVYVKELMFEMTLLITLYDTVKKRLSYTSIPISCIEGDPWVARRFLSQITDFLNDGFDGRLNYKRPKFEYYTYGSFNDDATLEEYPKSREVALRDIAIPKYRYYPVGRYIEIEEHVIADVVHDSYNVLEFDNHQMVEGGRFTYDSFPRGAPNANVIIFLLEIYSRQRLRDNDVKIKYPLITNKVFLAKRDHIGSTRALDRTIFEIDAKQYDEILLYPNQQVNAEVRQVVGKMEELIRAHVKDDVEFGKRPTFEKFTQRQKMIGVMTKNMVCVAVFRAVYYKTGTLAILQGIKPPNILNVDPFLAILDKPQSWVALLDDQFVIPISLDRLQFNKKVIQLRIPKRNVSGNKDFKLMYDTVKNWINQVAIDRQTSNVVDYLEQINVKLFLSSGDEDESNAFTFGTKLSL